MDQDAFRQLLQTSKASGSSGFSASRNVFSKKQAPSTSKAQTISASEPAFKPRKVKKSDAQYRDRAAERRTGADGDYAQVEAVLEDFEKRNTVIRNKAALEEQRKYLGGDGDHTILVKGLDFALLEQNKAREAAAANEDDDELLDQALQGAVPPTGLVASGSSSSSKKRTREDLVRQLKEKRACGGEVTENGKGGGESMEEAKKQGKFKPIGFKPIGSTNEATKKSKKVKESEKGGERKKKRRKVADEGTTEVAAKGEKTETSKPHPEPVALVTGIPAEAEAEPLLEDFDIFAGASEYEGLGEDDEDDEDEVISTQKQLSRSPTPENLSVNPTRRWIDTHEPGEVEESKPSLLSSILKSKFDAKPDAKTKLTQTSTTDTSQRARDEDMDEDMEEDKPMRLQPLEGSGPSVKELLEMDKASGRKWKKKEKKKGGGTRDGESEKKQNAEAKAERDYKRLKNYTNSKQG